jgi:hypothetical protein
MALAVRFRVPAGSIFLYLDGTSLGIAIETMFAVLGHPYPTEKQVSIREGGQPDACSREAIKVTYA